MVMNQLKKDDVLSPTYLPFVQELVQEMNDSELKTELMKNFDDLSVSMTKKSLEHSNLDYYLNDKNYKDRF
jgi:hypothetical protein